MRCENFAAPKSGLRGVPVGTSAKALRAKGLRPFLQTSRPCSRQETPFEEVATVDLANGKRLSQSRPDCPSLSELPFDGFGMPFRKCTCRFPYPKNCYSAESVFTKILPSAPRARIFTVWPLKTVCESSFKKCGKARRSPAVAMIQMLSPEAHWLGRSCMGLSNSSENALSICAETRAHRTTATGMLVPRLAHPLVRWLCRVAEPELAGHDWRKDQPFEVADLQIAEVGVAHQDRDDL